MVVRKPQAYTGNEPYLFVSYAHKDKDRVYPIIEGLQRRGLRVWYDEELGGGDDWIKKVATRLENCTQVVCFLSQSFIDSRNCKNEINMAADENKGPILTSLEDVKLPADMRLNFSNINVIKRSNYQSLDEFIDKIALTGALRPCCYDRSKLPVRKQSDPVSVNTPVSRPAPVKSAPARKRSSSRKGKIIAIAGAAVAVLALVLVLVIPRLGGNTDPTGGNLDGPGSSTPGSQLPDDQEGRYELAMEYIQEGNYDGAYEILKELGDYSDSASQLKAIRENAFLQRIRKAQPGEIVYWGSYEQDAVTSNGKEDIAWIVLYDDNGRKLLLSQKSLDCQPYHEQQAHTTWKTSNLRQWRNDDFYWEAFTETEQNALYLPVIATNNSEDTRDYVYVLTMEEANLYIDLFVNDVPTEYAIRQGASKDSYGWWLRDANNGAYHMGIACMGNDKSMINTKVDATGIAVRPSIWVDTRTEDQLEAEYTAALNLFEKKNYKKALPAFEALGDYKDSMEYCERLPQLILMKPYAEAEVGDEVRIGNYDWIVVEKQVDKILVVSKYSVGVRDFVGAGWEITWDISGVREYLNGEFLNNHLKAGDEKSLILPTQIATQDNPEYGTTGGAEVTDRVFLLSYEEVLRYFPNDQDRMLTTETDKNTTVTWWLRTMGKDITYAVCVDENGKILLEGYSTSPFAPVKLHARPAMWIKTAE